MTMRMIKYLFLNLGQVTEAVFDDQDLSEEANFITWRKANNFSYVDIFDRLGPNCEDILINGHCKSRALRIEPLDTIEFGRCQRVEFISGRAEIIGK